MRTLVGAIAAVLLAAGSTAGQDAGPARRSRQPIRESAERQIEAIVRAHIDPCLVARDRGVPCFPVSIESQGPRFSVKESLRTYRPDGRPAPGVPTSAEMQKQMSGAPQSASGGVSTDPACAAKSLVRLFKGSPNTFFLYRTWNAKGEEEPLLADRRLDPGSYASPAVRYEFVGEFRGECQAIDAWRRALRKSMEPAPPPGPQP